MKVYLVEEKLAMVTLCFYSNSLECIMSLFTELRKDFHSPSVDINVNYRNVWIGVIGPPRYDGVIGMFYKIDEYEVPSDYIRYDNWHEFAG
jgi:hypothetical protein